MVRLRKIPNKKQPVANVASQPRPEADALFLQGLGLHQTGQLAQAKAFYEQVLARQPRHFDALHLLGAIASQSQNPALAAALIGKAIEVNPNNASAYYNRGLALQELKRLDEAVASYDKAVAIRPDYAGALNNRGNALKDLKRLDAALASYDQAIAHKPDYAEAFYNRGVTLQELERLDEALASYDAALALQPEYAAALNNRGNALKELGRLEEALMSYDKAIAIQGDYADAFNNRGLALHQLKRLDEALDSYERAIDIQADSAELLNNRGVLLQELERWDDALDSYEMALIRDPGYADAFNNMGNTLQELGRLDDALASYGKAVAIEPDYASAFFGTGLALQKLKRLPEALASYDKAIDMKPDHTDAHVGRGNTLQALERPDEALDCYDMAITIEPECASAFYGRGLALQNLKRLPEALASYDKSITIQPDNAGAFANRGETLHELGHLDEALVSFERALSIQPDFDLLLGNTLHIKMKICDWSDIDTQLHLLDSLVSKDIKVIPPFALLSLTDNPASHLHAAKILDDKSLPKASPPLAITKSKINKKIRIGYYSADFRNHAVSYLIAGLFETHETHFFEVYGFSFGPPTQDKMRQRISKGFDQFFDVSDKSDTEISTLSRGLEIDIAVNLNGFTKYSRNTIFSERCAPIQVSYLGYPGTMGVSYIDYIIADNTVIPEDSRHYYTEKIVYLPHSYQVNDATRKISNRVFTRQEVGLPESSFVFCCFNNNHKILPATFDSWMRILLAVESSVLWLLEDNPTAATNLRKEAEFRGVKASRLVFAKRINMEDHLARHRMADLFIDTLPYNAHTTASDALWAGLPVLTLPGQSFSARVGASLLKALDIPELIVETPEQYESQAIRLASNPTMLSDIKEKLKCNRLTTPLFNTKLFARHIEAAFTEMHTRYHAGLQPEHIHVSELQL